MRSRRNRGIKKPGFFGKTGFLPRVEALESRTLLDASAVGPEPAPPPEPNAVPEPGQFSSWQNFGQHLIDASVKQWGNQFGQSYPNYNSCYYVDGFVRGQPCFLGGGGSAAAFDGDAAVAPSNLERTASPDFSETNVQELGVDEADIIKTDGNYLYVLSDQDLVIIDAWPANESRIVSRTRIEGYSIASFLHGDRLTVISGGWGDRQVTGDDGLTETSWTKVSIFDVTDRSAPAEVQATYLDGNFVNTRSIGSNVYVIVQNYPTYLLSPQSTCTESTCTYETEAEYRSRMENEFYDALPRFYSRGDVAGGALEQSGPLTEPSNIYKPLDPDNMDYVSVAVFDVTSNQPGAVNSVAVMSETSPTVYASIDSLYLAQPFWNWIEGDDWSWSEHSEIYKLSLAGTDINLAASGEVTGHALNQFSMDEEAGYFRIATTTNSSSGTASQVHIMAEAGGALNTVGSVENLAPGEQIFAVRFFTDRAFVVTFLQTDPLFTLDLSDPESPQLVGELVIPGFSRYLHPIDDNHVLGFGRDADENGRARGLQISLFDVSDMANPTLAHKYVIDTESWSFSEAEWDHHAIAYFPERGILSIPVHIGATWGPDGMQSPDRYELQLFQIDVAAGISLLGQVDHDSPVRRSVRIDNFVYSFAENDIKVHSLSDLQTLVAEVTLREGERRWGYGWYGDGIVIAGDRGTTDVESTESVSPVFAR